MITANEYIDTLRDLARQCDESAEFLVASITEENVSAAVILMRDANLYKRRSAAIRWAIEQAAAEGE